MISGLCNFTSHRMSHALKQAPQAENNTILMAMWYCASAMPLRKPFLQLTSIREASVCKEALLAKVRLTRPHCRGELNGATDCNQS